MRINNLTKKYDSKIALDNVSIDIPLNKITCILGMSGSGKTTMLKAIAGLIDYEGEITNINKLSYIFQDDRLVDNITVVDNLRLVSNDDNKIDQLLNMLSIKELKYVLVKKLSGGEKKRVNIIRAFLYDGDVILADEALSFLDDINRYKILDYVIDLWKKTKKTIVWVTHSINEALYIADKIYILNDGRMVKELILDDKKNRDIEEITEYYKSIVGFFKEI